MLCVIYVGQIELVRKVNDKTYHSEAFISNLRKTGCSSRFVSSSNEAQTYMVRCPHAPWFTSNDTLGEFTANKDSMHCLTDGVSGAWGCVDKRDVYSEIDRSTTNHAASELFTLWVVTLLTLDSWFRHLANPLRCILQLQ